MSEKKYTNSLINETSPYLLQHAHNPVNWYQWGIEAFEKAIKENKPIFLSVGYSACHWCHVMENESFEDEETAELMNKLFINIKVDREERPDIDSIYMNVVQIINRSGGWPMSVFLTPDKKPYYGGTYFPKYRKYYMPSFKEILISASKYYHEQKEDLERNAEALISNLELINKFNPSQEDFTYNIIKNAIKDLEDAFDWQNGGFGSKPKFPNIFNLNLLLKHYLNTKDETYLKMVELTINKMLNGGIYDHLGGGFFRYSVDETWTIPHFEKMLYDNALIIKLLFELYQITKKEIYLEKGQESLEYIIKEMTYNNGGFYSTQDADSEGVEGKFYVWSFEEILNILSEKDGKIFSKYYDVTKEGNFEHGKSNLNILYSKEEIQKVFEIEKNELDLILENGKNKLFQERTKRVYPSKDTKILVSWNALMLSAFIKAYKITQDKKYLDISEKTINFIYSNMYKDGLLLRSYKNNQAKFNAYLEDYVFLIDSLIDLYQATLKKDWLQKALDLNEKVIKEFWNEKDGGFFFTGRSHEKLLVKIKDIADTSIPSSNSIALKNLYRLSKITDDKTLLDKFEKSLYTFNTEINKYSFSVSSLLCVLDMYLKPPSDIVLVANNLEDIKLNKIKESYNPDAIIHFIGENESSEIDLLKNKKMINNKPTAYYCENFTCKAPINLD